MKKERLDKILTKRTKMSRTQVQKMIKEGLVSVNNKIIITPHFLISPEDKLKLKRPKRQKELKRPVPDLKILYEDDDVIVFEKPAGLIVHAAPGKDETTVVDALIKHYPPIKKVSEPSAGRPGIVHRLDKLASGVMIAAKRQPAFEFLKRQFAERLVKKEYLVLVYGTPPKETGTISFKLARSKTRGRIVARPKHGEGKEAVTHYEVIKKFKTTTLLRVQTETGRTHQIRAHLRALNLPVVGDPLYKKRRMKKIRPISLLRCAPYGAQPRLFLHAHRLTISLPNGEIKTFVSPLPDDLKNFLKER